MRLEPVERRHDAGLHAGVLASRTELIRWMPWAAGATEETQRQYSQRAWLAWSSGTEFHFAIVESEVPIGIVGINRVGPGQGELHYWLRTDRTGRGLASEAAAAVVSFAFEQLGLDGVVLHVGEDNRRSRRVAEKLGAVLIGPLPGGMAGGEGTFPAVVYAIESPPPRRGN